MKLIHFTIGVAFVLIGFTAYLAWQANLEARGARRELEMFRQQQNDQIAAGALASPSILDAPGSSTHLRQPTSSVTPRLDPVPTSIQPPPRTATGGLGIRPPPSTSVVGDEPPPLTPQQRVLMGLPVIARITKVVDDQGFVVINAGTAKGLSTGMRFDVRRDASLVGRLVVSDTVEEEEAIADVVQSSVPIGILLKEGDELVQASAVSP